MPQFNWLLGNSPMTQPLPRYCGAFFMGMFLQRLFVVVLQRTFCEELFAKNFAGDFLLKMVREGFIKVLPMLQGNDDDQENLMRNDAKNYQVLPNHGELLPVLVFALVVR